MKITGDLMYIIGVYVASPEGITDRFFLLSTDNRCNNEIRDRLKKAFKASKLEPEIKEDKETGKVMYVFSRFSALAKEVGNIMPITKGVPIDLLTNCELQNSFMQGFFDRCACDSRARHFSTKHIEIVYGIKALSTRMGYKVDVSTVTCGSYCAYNTSIML